MWKQGINGPASSPGAMAYAARQSTLWWKFADVANSVFKKTTEQYQSPVDIM
jgi:hypothetical protein